MKKILLAATLLLLSMGLANAQRPVIKVDANLGFSNFVSNSKVEGISVENSMIMGYRFGVGAEFGLGTPGLYLNPGIVFSSKGSEMKVKEVDELLGIVKEEVKIQLHYIQLPIHIGYRSSFADKMAISFQAGPFLAYGMTGKTKNHDEDLFKTLDLKRLDFGLGIQAALHYDRYYAQVGYEYGFIDLEKSDEGSINNNNFFVGLGVRF